jgi:heptosyltransferase-1
MRVLIVRLGAMGDILHALPAVTSLRAVLPDARIGWAVEPQWVPLLRAGSIGEQCRRGPEMPVVDAVHSVPAKAWARRPLSTSTVGQIRRLRAELRAQCYHLCIDLQGAVRSAWIGRMSGAERLAGEAEPREALARWLFKERVATRGVHVIEQAREVVAAALGPCGVGTLAPCAAVLPTDPQAEQWCVEWLGQRRIERFIMIHPGAGWGAKRWPPERYAAAGRALAAMGYTIVVNSGPGESRLAAAICDSVGVGAFPMNGDLGQLIACTRRAGMAIGGDSGPVHLAAALGIPVLGIYGPTDPARNGPYETRARVLRHPSSRRDHSRNDEPEAGLMAIGVDEVIEAARDLLAQPEPIVLAGRQGAGRQTIS